MFVVSKCVCSVYLITKKVPSKKKTEKGEWWMFAFLLAK